MARRALRDVCSIGVIMSVIIRISIERMEIMDDFLLAEMIGAVFSFVALAACVVGFILGLNKMLDSLSKGDTEEAAEAAEEGVRQGGRALAFVLCLTFVGVCMALVAMLPE